MERLKQYGVVVMVIILCFELAWLGERDAAAALTPEPAPSAAPSATPEPAPAPTPSPAPQGPEPEPEPLPLPDGDGMWRLAIASADYPLEGEYEVETAPVDTGYLFDARAAGALQAMLNAARADGMDLRITSAWRSRETQAALYENRVYRFQLEGYSREEAEEIGATVVARPGTSEHELGLSVDLITGTYNVLDEGFADQPEYQWLLDNCAKYGFIQRYPPEKSDITGIIWEPWHFRYVGAECAGYIMRRGLCLEEFLERAGLLPETNEEAGE